MNKITIVGTGPAGLTAAIYAARANLSPVIMAGNQPGGQLTQTTEIENFPGFPTGIQGFDLMMNIQQQAQNLGAKIENKLVKSVEFCDGGPQKLIMNDGEIVESEVVVIATGAQARWLGLESEQALKNKGVSACATCDGAFFRDLPIMVIGGGDTALEEAIFLTRFGSKVMLVHRRDEFRGSKILQKRVLDNPKIEVFWDSVLDEVKGVEENKVTGAVLKNVKTGDLTDVPCDAVFIAIGHSPNTKAFVGQLEMKDGYIVRQNPGSSKTSVDGVFVAGDCCDNVYRQAITAAGMGCMAAIDAEHWLAEKE